MRPLAGRMVLRPDVCGASGLHGVDAHGNPVSDAVGTLVPDVIHVARVALPARETRYVDQRDEPFIPNLQIFHPGDKVVFRNSDTTRHQIYSFSKTRKFELVLRPGESSPPMELDSTGIAAVGCKILDEMVTYLSLTSAAHAAMLDSGGVARMDDLSPSQYTASIWPSQLHPGHSEPTRSVSISVARARPHCLSNFP